MARRKLPEILNAKTRLTHFVDGFNVGKLIEQHYQRRFDESDGFENAGLSDNWASLLRFDVDGKRKEYSDAAFAEWYDGGRANGDTMQGILDDLCKQKVIPRGVYVLKYDF